MIASQNFLPNGVCYLWNPQLLALHAVSDSLIFLSCLAISCTLSWLLWRERRRIPFVWIFAAFGLFIVASGFTHAMDIVVLWRPFYWLAGDIKAVTAVASLATAVTLPFFVVPRIARLLEDASESCRNERRFLAESNLSNDAFLILESVRDGSGEINDFRFGFVNAGGLQFLGAKSGDLRDKLLCRQFPDNRSNGFFEKYRQVAETGEPLEYEFLTESETGDPVWFQARALKLEDGVAVTVANITARKESELKNAEGHLQERFISHVSHELRTPLTAIYFFTTNVYDGLLGELTSEQREHLALALDNVKQLKDMVSDLLDLTRLDTHKLAVDPQRARPARLVGEAINTCRTNAVAKKINLRSRLAPDLPAVWADPSRVRQILINLIDNGIKFTPRGGAVSVEARIFPDEPDHVRFSITDTGCGINSRDREMIFDRLAQVKNNSDESRAGLGLGLFIARDLVTQHGGRIWVESQIGHGSTFCFTLPAFSLEKRCRPVVSSLRPDDGGLATLAMSVKTEGPAQKESLHETRKMVERCLRESSSVLLMSPDDVPESPFLILTGLGKAAGIETQIREQLPHLGLRFDVAPLPADFIAVLDQRMGAHVEQGKALR